MKRRTDRTITARLGTLQFILCAAALSACGGGDEGAAQNSPAIRSDVSVAANGLSAPVTEKSMSETARAKPAAVQRRVVRAKSWKGVTALGVSRDGGLVGAAVEGGQIRLIDPVTARVVKTLPGHEGALASGVLFNADGSRVVSVGRDSLVKVWNVASGELSLTLRAHEHGVRTVATSTDAAWIASAGDETRVMFWNAATGRLTRILRGSVDFVNSLAFSPDGVLLAGGSADGRILVWNAATGALVQTLSGHTDEVNAVAFSPNGSVLASAGSDARVLLWDVSPASLARQQQQELPVFAFVSHRAPVRSVAFSRDGVSLASGGEDAQILVWDVATRQLSSSLTGSGAFVNTLSFDGKDANQLISGSEDNQLVFWNVRRGTPRSN